MHGTTFHASRTACDAQRADRGAHRADRPRLTLVAGTADTRPTPSHVVPYAHPASPDFIPDGIPGTPARYAVHSSGPESSPVRRSSRGSTSPDPDDSAHSGSGPHVPPTAVFQLLHHDRAPDDGLPVRSPLGAWVHLVR